MSELSAPSPSTPKHMIWDVAVLVLPFVGLAPMLALYAIYLGSKPEMVLLPLCWLVLGAIAYNERKTISDTRWRVVLSYVAQFFAVTIGVASVIYFSPWAACLAMAFVFIGWGLVRLGYSSPSRILGLSTLVLICLTLPFGFDAKVSLWTNDLVVRFCSAVLDLFNVYHLYQSPYLALKDHHFEVNELLNNAFSLRFMAAISIIVSLIWKRPFMTTMLNVLSALIWTLLGKIFYLFITAVFSSNGYNISESIWGSVILCGIFFVFFLLLLATDGFWNAMLSPIRAGDEGVYRSATADFFNRVVIWPGKMEFQERSGRFAKPTRIPTTLSFQPTIAMAFGILMALLMIPTSFAIFKNDLLLNRANYLSIDSVRIPDGKSLPDDFFPKQRLRQFRMLASSGMIGGTSKTLVWNYGGSGVESIVILRFPIRGWVTDNSSSFAGWKPVESKMMDDDAKWPWSESLFEGENAGAGLLFSSQLHTRGEPYIPTEGELVVAGNSNQQQNRFLTPAIFEMFNPKQDILKPQTFFIQLRFQSETEIRPPEKQQLLEKFKEARKILADKLLGTASETRP